MDLDAANHQSETWLRAGAPVGRSLPLVSRQLVRRLMMRMAPPARRPRQRAVARGCQQRAVAEAMRILGDREGHEPTQGCVVRDLSHHRQRRHERDFERSDEFDGKVVSVRVYRFYCLILRTQRGMHI